MPSRSELKAMRLPSGDQTGLKSPAGSKVKCVRVPGESSISQMSEFSPRGSTRPRATPAGQVEGVKYDRLNVVLVNAMQQQQRAIESLRHENAELKARFAALEHVVQQIKDQQAMFLKASR